MPAEVQPGTSLAAVAAYLPETSFTLDKVGELLGLTEVEIRRYRRFFGLGSVRWDPGARQSDLLVAAARRVTSLAGNEHRVRYVLHARTIEPAGPYSANPLHEAVRELGLTHAVAVAVSQHACASGLLAIDLAGRMLAATGDPDALVLLLTGEKTYPHVAHHMPAATLMGESAAACLVALGGSRDRLLAYTTHTYGEFCGVTRSTESAAEFQRMYPPALAGLIRRTVEQAGLDLDDVRLVLPHNVNRISWVQVCQLLPLPVDRVLLDNIAVTGHSFCADPFVNYTVARSRGLLRPGDHYLMASVGLGSTFSVMLFRH